MSIGETLAQARREAGLSVTQVSQKTRIREGIIRDIERDDYSACGGDFYARGHIRAIARASGTDSEPLIREYDEARRPPDEYPATEDEPGYSGSARGHEPTGGYEAAVDDTTFGGYAGPGDHPAPGGYAGPGEYTPPLRFGTEDFPPDDPGPPQGYRGSGRDEFEAPEEITSPHQVITASQIAALEDMMSTSGTRAPQQAGPPGPAAGLPAGRFPATPAARRQAPGGLQGPSIAADTPHQYPPLADDFHDASPSAPHARRPEPTVSADTVRFESPAPPDGRHPGPPAPPDGRHPGPPDTQRFGPPAPPDERRSGPAAGTTYGHPRPSGARGTGGPATSAPRGHRGPVAAAAGGFARPGQSQGPAGPGRPDRLTILAAVLALAIFGGLIYLLIPGSHPAQPVRSDAANGLARHHAATHHGSPAAKHAGSATRTAPSSSSSAAGGVLTPARAVAFGPGGPAHGDNPQNARLAIDRNPASGWQTDWYATAAFGNLKPGTGLLLDMGHPVTITSARVNLGSASGADLQLRVGGPAAVLRELRPAASASNAGGPVRLHLASPAHGRYVLIWFTRLPPDSAGTYRAGVYNIVLRGQG